MIFINEDNKAVDMLEFVFDSKFLSGMKEVWTEEEKTYFKDAPREWILEYYKGTEVREYGPGLIKIKKLLTQLNPSDTDFFKNFSNLLKEHETISNQKPSLDRFIQLKFKMFNSVEYELEDLINKSGYTVAYNKYLLALPEIKEGNLFKLNPLLLSGSILALQIEHVSEDAKKYSKVFYDCGFTL